MRDCVNNSKTSTAMPKYTYNVGANSMPHSLHDGCTTVWMKSNSTSARTDRIIAEGPRTNTPA